MIIGFWSDQPGRGSVTYNMLASAIGMSAKTRNNIVLMQGKSDYNRIEYAFTPYVDNGMLKEDYGYYNYGGMDNIVNMLESGLLDEVSYMKELVRVSKSNLFYLCSGNGVLNQEFYKKFWKKFNEYALFLKEISCVNLIELPSGYDEITSERLELFDLIVVNISQDGKGMKKLLSNHIIKEKAIFIVGSYDSASEYSINNLRRTYSIASDRIANLPYNIKFRDSVCAGRCMEFVDRHRDDKREDEEYELIKSINIISDMLMKRCKIE